MKYVLLTILLCLTLSACVYNVYDDTADGDTADSVSPPQDKYGLQAVATHTNEFGFSFMLRNQTGHRLYYNDDFRLDTVPLSLTHNRAGVQFINPGDTKNMHINWDATRQTGVYTFERDFFLDADITELYTTLTLPFDIIGWYHFTDDAMPLPCDMQARREERQRESLAFKISGGTSDIIVLASEVAVSRTEVKFRTANLSSWPFMHGLDYHLLIYDNGWTNAPTVLDSWGIPSIGFGMIGGDVIDDHFDFAWLYGQLANGRYMILRQHSEDHSRPGAPRVQETLIVEFMIDDSTPMSLSDATPAKAVINAYITNIIPTGLTLTIINSLAHELLYSSPPIVQKYVYGMWENIYELAAPTRYQIPVAASSNNVIDVCWAGRYGKLPPGRYRIDAHLSSPAAGTIVSYDFIISQEMFDDYISSTQINPMFEQNVVVTDVTATTAVITIRWENVSNRVFYTPNTHFFIEQYCPVDGRDSWNRIVEGWDANFSGPNVDFRTVTIDISGGGSILYETTAVYPGQHVYQTIEWGGALPSGRYVVSVAHFHPEQPGIMYWIRAWERHVVEFVID